MITGGINNGIQIQNCPIIQAAPTPSFHVVSEDPIKRNDNGTFTRSILIAVDAPYVPNNMVVIAKGQTVTDLNVSNRAVMFGGRATDPKIQMYGVSQPSGQYTIAVTTSDSTSSPSLEIQFNIPNINWDGTPSQMNPTCCANLREHSFIVFCSFNSQLAPGVGFVGLLPLWERVAEPPAHLRASSTRYGEAGSG
jgi:hypothetical protein